MAYTGNTPSNLAMLRLEARKSFSFSLLLQEPNDAPIDITGCSFEFVMKGTPLASTGDSDEDNLVVNSTAEIVDPLLGSARFNLQASDLASKPQEYPFAIVMHTPEGYSAVIVKGVVDLLENTEYASVNTTYDEVQPDQGVTVTMAGMAVLEVTIGGMLPPGMNYMSDQEKADLAQLVEDWLGVELGTAAFKNVDFFAPAAAGVPEAGIKKYVLTKTGNGDYQMTWLPAPDTGGTNVDVVEHADWVTLIIGGSSSVDDGGGDLDATDIPQGFVPTASGIDSWGWAAIPDVDFDVVEDTATYVKMTPAERDKLASIEEGAQENVDPDWSDVQNKPDFGSAAEQDAGDFADANHTHRFLDLDGVSVSYDEPSGIPEDGDIHLQILG